MTEPLLMMFTVYEHPSDFPDHWVVRAWTVVHGQPVPVSGHAVVATTYDEAVQTIPDGLVRVPRDEADDPAIKETWL